MLLHTWGLCQRHPLRTFVIFIAVRITATNKSVSLQQRSYRSYCAHRYSACFYMKWYRSVRTESGASLPIFL